MSPILPSREADASPRVTDPKPQPTVQLVIAHYNENLDWLVPFAEESIIYTKGPGKATAPFAGRTVPLPNIGREGHTYLHHIITAYDDLAEVSVFLQGRIDDHISLSPSEVYSRASFTQPGEVTTFPWRELELFDLWSGIPWTEYPSWNKWSTMNQWVLAPKSPAQCWFELMGYDKLPASVGYQPGAMFAVHRDTIRRHPRVFYEKMQNDFFGGEMANVNPETGHYMERWWQAIFAPDEYICWDAEKDTVKEDRNKWGQLARGKWHRVPKNVDVDPYLEESLLSSGSDRDSSGRSASPSSGQSTPIDRGIGEERQLEA